MNGFLFRSAGRVTGLVGGRGFLESAVLERATQSKADGRRSVDVTVTLEDPRFRRALYGPADRNLRRIRSAFDVRISAREDQVHVSGDAEAVEKVRHVLGALQDRIRETDAIDDETVARVIRQASRMEEGDRERALQVYLSAAHIVPKSAGQRAYVDAIRSHDLTICLGPAGTGKTFLAVAYAVSMLKDGLIQSIALVRPAVEAGEKLGYLPGDMQAKVNPYLRPLFDAMHDMMPFDQVKRFLENDVIEVIPLAFMRGRTLNNAVIILDEAQNATRRQMMMFLTRLGFGSWMIVTGDDTQVDLGSESRSGLIDAVHKLRGTEGVAVVRLTEVDIVRHPLVHRIVDAYGRSESDDRENRSDGSADDSTDGDTA